MKLLEPVLVIGAGKMGGAILSAWLEAAVEATSDEAVLDLTQVKVEDPGPPADMVDLLGKFDIKAEAKTELDQPPGLVMLGVKPQVMQPVIEGLAPRLGPSSLVLSILAGKRLEDLSRGLPEGTAIVRAMPNTPVQVAAGMTVFVGNRHVTDGQRAALDALFASTGTTAWLEDETLMDAVTGVSGSGPAYIFYLAECLAKAGVAQGLPEELALTLAKNTIYGAGTLMVNSDAHPSVLRENVTSKAGTTAAALDVLMAREDGIGPVVERAIAAAAARSKALSG